MTHSNMKNTSSSQLKAAFANSHPFDIAHTVLHQDKQQQLKIMTMVPLDKINDVFEHLPQKLIHEYIDALSHNEKTELLNVLAMDGIRDLIFELSIEEQNEMIGLLSDAKATIIRKLLAYAENSAASIMSTDFLTIYEDSTIQQATALVIDEVKDNDYIDEIFVVDHANQWVGNIDLRDLLIARKNDDLKAVISQEDRYVFGDDTAYDAIRTLRNYDINVLPVLDKNKELIGIITADDALDAMIDEYEDDMERMAAVGEYDEESGALTRTKQRLPWLLASIILNLVIAGFLAVFQQTVETIVALVLFQPMILGMAGNIGTQSIAVTILGIHHNDLNEKHQMRRHIIKEIMIGLVNSLLVAVCGMGIAYIILHLSSGSGSEASIGLPVVVGLSLFGGMLISAIAGVCIPIILTRLTIDPASASGPIISTVNDLFALLIYFGIATVLLL